MIYQLGARLKKLREDRGLTQGEIADFLGVKSATISLYESSSCQPTTDVLVKMARLYDTTTDYLLGIDTKKSIVTKDLLPLEKAMLLDFNNTITAYLINKP